MGLWLTRDTWKPFFVGRASQVDEISIIDIAICFFGVQGLLIPLGKNSFKLIFFNKNYCEALPLHFYPLFHVFLFLNIILV